MSFVLFLILNAILLLRPEELFPELAGARLYLITIILCILTALPGITVRLTPDALREQPITACVIGLWLAGILSQLVRGQFGVAIDFAGEFGKVILYYLLLVSVVDTAGRLRAFLGWIVAFVAVMATLGLLQYHGIIDNEALQPLERRDFSQDSDDPTTFLQLRATGIFNDPNDLCLILVTGSICSLYRAITAANWFGRVLWLAPIGLFAYAVVLTQSRGGLIGLLVAGLVWGYGRYGWRKTVLAAVALAPVTPLLVSERQANIDLGQDDTLYTRVQHWSDGLVALMRNPVTGIGAGEYVEEAEGHVAHNSFVHAFVENGVMGGSLFLAAFGLSVVGLHRVRPDDPVLARLRPFVMAMVVGYAAGVFSLSRDYVCPTYLVLGLAAAYLTLARAGLPGWFRVDSRLVFRVFGFGVLGLVGLKVLTQALLSYGG